MSQKIQKFYEGQVIFLTGGSGFLGKLLLLKLLQSCPGIAGIIVLLRQKRGLSCRERLFGILSSPVFSSVPKERLMKVSYVEGDIAKEGLGLSIKHRQMLMASQVSLVFHIAASVSFQETLLQTIKTNTLPAIEVVRLCQAMSDIKALVYVSTAYSQCPRREIGEEVYPVPIDYRQLFNGAVNEDIAMKVWKNGKWPNFYTFSKALAEELIQKMNGHLPVAIFRPSLVTNTLMEPFEGWMDNSYNITRILRTAYLGYDRIGICNVGKVVDIVPADMCVNAMVAVARETAKPKYRGQTTVYNFVSGAENPLTWREYWAICGQHILKNPTCQAQWCYLFILTKQWPIYLILWLCLDMIPAVLIQGLQYVTSGPKRTIKEALYALQYTVLVRYFGENDWLFQNTNVQSLQVQLTPEECDIFYFDIKQLNWASYLERCVIGVRKFIIKDDLSTLPQARKRYKVLYALHCIVMVCLLYLCCRVMWHLLI